MAVTRARAKQYVLDLLNKDWRLKRNVQSISAAWHDSEKGYPQITVTQISSVPTSYSDNSVDFRNSLIQIDIWDTENPFIIADKVRDALARAGYEAEGEREQNEKTVNRVILEYRLLED